MLGSSAKAHKGPAATVFNRLHPWPMWPASETRGPCAGRPRDLKRSSGLVERSLRVAGRERVERQDVGLGVFEHGGDLAYPAVQMRDRFREPIVGLGLGVGVKDRPDQRAEQAVLVLARMAETVTREMDGAALPGAAKDLGDRGLQAGNAHQKWRVGRRPGRA